MYGERFGGKTEYRDQVWKTLTSQYFERWIPAQSTVLDLGAGYCEFINNVRARRKLALDLNPDTKHRADASVEVVLHDCSTAWPIEASSIDVVFT
jgi:SAM-dependent methyltransferase